MQQPAAGKCRAKPSTGRAGPGRRHGAEEYVTVASLSCNITVATACGREMLRYTSSMSLLQQPAAGKCGATSKPSTGRRRAEPEVYVTVASCNIITVAIACGRLNQAKLP